MADKLTMITVYPDPKSGLLPVRAFGPGLPGAIRNHPGFDFEEAYAAALALMSPATLALPRIHIPPPTDEDLDAAGLSELDAPDREWADAPWTGEVWDPSDEIRLTERAPECDGAIDGAVIPDDDRAA